MFIQVHIDKSFNTIATYLYHYLWLEAQTNEFTLYCHFFHMQMAQEIWNYHTTETLLQSPSPSNVRIKYYYFSCRINYNHCWESFQQSALIFISMKLANYSLI